MPRLRCCLQQIRATPRNTPFLLPRCPSLYREGSGNGITTAEQKTIRRTKNESSRFFGRLTQVCANHYCVSVAHRSLRVRHAPPTLARADWHALSTRSCRKTSRCPRPRIAAVSHGLPRTSACCAVNLGPLGKWLADGSSRAKASKVTWHEPHKSCRDDRAPDHVRRAVRASPNASPASG